MQTVKKWEAQGSNTFNLIENDQLIGSMEVDIHRSTRKAVVRLKGKEWVFRRTGFWKNNLEVTDSNGNTIAKVYPEKWYKSTSLLEYDNKKYTIRVRNNPLAEWVLQENNTDLLAYGLTAQKGKTSIRITTAEKQPDYLFDSILWYLFYPVAAEQVSDDLTFLLVVTA